MILKCTDSGDYHLTVGKIYEGEFSLNPYFEWSVVNDKGHKHEVEHGLFIEISKMREDIISELGIK